MNHVVAAELVANVAQVLVNPGDQVAPGDMLVLLDSMKMEIPVLTEFGGTVAEVAVARRRRGHRRRRPGRDRGVT